MRIRDLELTNQHHFWANTKQWMRSRQGLTQFLLAVMLGFSIAAAGAIWYKLYGWKIIEPPIRSMLAEAEDTAEMVTEFNDLPIFRFDIDFEDYQTMAAQREKALEDGILLLDDEDWIRAQIRYQDETIPVRLRLKGDWIDHLGENKWSFRVQTRNDAVLMGMRSFSVQSPATRFFLNEWLFLEDLRRADILAPRYSFVNVMVNGEDWGIYALEESFSKELLESQGRRESVIVRFDESLFWRRRALFGGEDGWKLSVDPIALNFEMASFASVDEFNTNKVQNNPVLREQSTAALGLLRGFQNYQLSASEVFDADLVGRYLAHSNLWAARHGLTWHNERYYYNPLTSRLEPIGYDTMPFAEETASFFDLAQYDDLEIMRAYIQEVGRISQPGYVQELQAAYTDTFERYYAILSTEFPSEQLQAPWELLTQRQQLLASALYPAQTVYAYGQVNAPEPKATYDVQVGNVLRYAVTLQALRVGEREVTIQPTWISEQDQELVYPEAEPDVVLRRANTTVPRYVTLHIPPAIIHQLSPTDTLFYSNTLQIVTQLYGVDEPITVAVQQNYAPILSKSVRPTPPSVEQAVAQHPFLTLSDEPGFLELKSGTWYVQGDLILPENVGLWATDATTLTFDHDAIFFVTGPLLLQGPDVGRISFRPRQEHWAGMIVLNADSEIPSRLYNVDIYATSGISRAGWFATGGITFYESPVILENCRILGSVAEDAINVVRSKFQFVNTEFAHIASDAFDGDFVSGRVEQCAFHDILGDAVDVSGSNITVQALRLLRVRDKGVSAGEGSRVTVKDLYAKDVSMAIASKDKSVVSASNLDIENAWIAALAAYQKKLEYAPATIAATNVTFRDESRWAIVQSGSKVTIDGSVVETSDLDVDELYARLEAISKLQILDYRFGENIHLLGYEMAYANRDSEPGLDLTLYWQSDARLEQNYTVFVHIFDDAGTLVAQRDSMPQDNTFATSHWTVGPLIDDTHHLSLPADLLSGEYRVMMGLYLWQTGERLVPYAPDGQALSDGTIVVGTFEVE